MFINANSDKITKVLSFAILTRSLRETTTARLFALAEAIGDPKLTSMVNDLSENAKKLDAYVTERLELAHKKR